jgi:PAS domain S-box-containing protein
MGLHLARFPNPAHANGMTAEGFAPTEGEERLKQALCVAGLGVFERDLAGDVLTVTPRLREIFGWSADQCMTVSDFLARVHPADRGRVVASIGRASDPAGDGLLSLEHRLVLPDGEVRWIATNAQTFFETVGGQPRAVRIGTVLDITDRKQAEDQLRASQERYGLYEQGVNDGIWDWNIVTGEHYHSDRWKEIVGSRDDAVPNTESSFFDRIHPDDRALVETALRRHYDEGQRYAVEIRLRRRDGSYCWVLSRGEAVRDANGRPIRMVGALTDITDRKQAEEELRRAHDELEQRVQDRTHELQQRERALAALSASLLTAQEDERRRLARELHDDVTQQLALASIEIGTLASNLPASSDDTRSRLQALQQRVVQISRDVRSVSHGLHPALIEDLGLGAALESFCEEVQRARGLPLTFDGTVDDAGVSLASRSALYRVAQEALANAAKHARASRITVTLRRSDAALSLEIEDDGIGLDERRTGSGLGLVSMQERMRLVSGELRVLPRDGGGTRVIAAVPIGGAP